MKGITVFFATLFCQIMVNAQTMVPLWPAGQVPNFRKTEETEKWDSAEIIRISLVQTPGMAIYLPAKKSATGQAVIICPGGGYGILAWDWEGTDIAAFLVSKGIAAFVLKYRLPNASSNVVPHLSPLMDAQRAIRTVRANATKWNINPNKIGIMGFSAGGHLASTAATHFDAGNSHASDSIERQSSRPDFSILVYPVITMSKPMMHAGSRNNLIGANADSSLAQLYSNELQVTSATPPTILFHATDDKAVPVENSLLFYQACKNAGVPVALHIYPAGGHGYALAVGKPGLENWPDQLMDWLRSLQ
jgi:acetyl esterase/lipase